MLLPVLEKAKAQGIQRMSQLRQLGLAWQRYAGDHNHAVVLNAEGVPPERAWVLLDEREETFEGGWFGVNMEQEAWRASWAGSCHHRAGGLAFADGHAIVKRRVDGRTCEPVANGASWEFDEFQPENPDIRWLQERTTGRK